MIAAEDGRTSTENCIAERDNFWASNSNKQVRFVQQVMTLPKFRGCAAVAVPDNVVLEGGTSGWRRVVPDIPRRHWSSSG